MRKARTWAAAFTRGAFALGALLAAGPAVGQSPATVDAGRLPGQAPQLERGDWVLRPFRASELGVWDRVELQTSVAGWLGAANLGLGVGLVDRDDVALSLRLAGARTWSFHGQRVGRIHLGMSVQVGPGWLGVDGGGAILAEYGTQDCSEANRLAWAVPVRLAWDAPLRGRWGWGLAAYAAQRRIFREHVSEGTCSGEGFTMNLDEDVAGVVGIPMAMAGGALFWTDLGWYGGGLVRRSGDLIDLELGMWVAGGWRDASGGDLPLLPVPHLGLGFHPRG